MVCLVELQCEKKHLISQTRHVRVREYPVRAHPLRAQGEGMNGSGYFAGYNVSKSKSINQTNKHEIKCADCQFDALLEIIGMYSLSRFLSCYFINLFSL